MTTYVWKTLAVGAGVAVVALPTILGPPTVITPYPLIVLITAFTVGYPAFVFPALLFLAWSHQLLRGDFNVPRRSVGLLSVLTILTPVHFVMGWSYGIRWDGLAYVLGVTLLNGGILLILWLWFHRARVQPSFQASLSFHGLLFGWLAWCAFPNLGELP